MTSNLTSHEVPAIFDIQTFPLTGKRLIEASAGTGKTYSIANLFLRLVLGHGVETAYSVDQILVVTFTRAATAELSGRIRARLEQAFRDFRDGESKDDFINDLIAQTEDNITAIKALNAAILSMDEASISTIHSFAVKALQAFVFETGALAEVELSEGGSENTERLLDDLFRRLLILEEGEAKAIFAATGLGNRSLFHQYFGQFNTQAIYTPQLSLVASGEPLATQLNQVLQLVDAEDKDANAQRQKLIKSFIVQWLNFQSSQIDLSSMQLDEVITLINTKLNQKEAGDDLRRIITQTYPVCLVDEFQDTDPEQFRMFDQIYQQAPIGTGFFMIGDPKQSIYAFRGADIFSYLNVREAVKKDQAKAASGGQSSPGIFSLDTNWRSKQSLVDATNALFQESPPPQPPVFLDNRIGYQPVKSCESESNENKGDYYLGDGSQLSEESLIFVGNPHDDDIKKDTLLYQYAKDTACRISALLHSKSGARIKKGTDDDRPLSPGDIAVLVRSGREAQKVREALARPDIALRSVYMSQKDSVFGDSEVSEDLYFILVAIHEFSNKRRLKSALATPLLRGFASGFAELDQFETSDEAFELLTAEFSGYHKLWQENGILTALNHLFTHRSLFAAIARRQDSDRIFTDYRHLGDLLQQQDMQSGSEEQLIDWYASQLNDDSQLDEDSKRIRLESDENLVKIVTIFVAKGMEYPVVFLPFFYLPWAIDLKKKLPLYHDEENKFRATIDFESGDELIKQRMKRESLAEEMRLLYVAVTRAIYQCYIGISASTHYKPAVFDQTVWSHLLDIEEPRAQWEEIKGALKNRLGDDQSVAYALLDDVGSQLFKPTQESRPVITRPDEKVVAPYSSWQITSYSALAHGKKLVTHDKGDDEQTDPNPVEETQPDHLAEAEQVQWGNNARYTLKGSAVTGNCLHDIFEHYALDPAREFPPLVEKLLLRYGLDNPPRVQRGEFIEAISNWLESSLRQELVLDSNDTGHPTLLDLFTNQQVIPELAFDFAIGANNTAVNMASVNQVLNEAGLDGLPEAVSEIHGLMTGAIDLVFIHNSKVYVLDYKSNTLGKAPRFYDQNSMAACMRDSRYDLQYMIYSTAVHRYFSSHFSSRYAFEQEASKELSFGGVCYLFLRGMGLDDEQYRQHGVWFTRPQHTHIAGLDQAFSGRLAGDSR